jgi:hypothetical protein
VFGTGHPSESSTRSEYKMPSAHLSSSLQHSHPLCLYERISEMAHGCAPLFCLLKTGHVHSYERLL